jgi:hypothetical protein
MPESEPPQKKKNRAARQKAREKRQTQALKPPLNPTGESFLRRIFGDEWVRIIVQASCASFSLLRCRHNLPSILDQSVDCVGEAQ